MWDILDLILDVLIAALYTYWVHTETHKGWRRVWVALSVAFWFAVSLDIVFLVLK